MNSVSNPAVTAAQLAKKHAKSALSGKPAGDGGEFGGLFASLQAEAGGQDLAGKAGKASPPVEGLASQILGPSVHIITSETPTMSDDSLYAFARSQGMDESALALIFQHAASQPPAGGDGALTPDPGAALAAPALSEVAGEALLLNQQQLSLQTAAAATALNADAKTKAEADSAALPVTDADGMSALDLGDGTRIRWSVEQPGKAASEAAKPAQPAAEAVVNLATAVQNEEHDQPEPELAATLVLGDAETQQFAKRVQTKQTSLRAERLGSISSDSFKSAFIAGGLQAARQERDPAVIESLHLGTELTGEDLQLIWAHRQANAEQNSSNASQGSGQATGPQSDIDLRTEQYEKLTQRLGEALGQRLAAQIARGDWEVELALKPQDLGNIEIKLDMKKGNLEASFNASEAMTRDLIADSLPRLKETLAQSGMEVAQLNVNVRQDSQNGGNPTPGRQKSSGSISGVSKGGTTSTNQPNTDSLAARKPAADKDGLDVLV